jgi:transposase InsO family protein
MNVDLCFVPAIHECEQKLPAVSGSSGRLVIERPVGSEEEKHWPGRVFENEDQDYTEAMLNFVAASRKQPEDRSAPPETEEKKSVKAHRQALRQEEVKLRVERQAIRQERRQEDLAWRKLKEKRRWQKAIQSERSPQERKVHDEQWRIIAQHRRDTMAHRRLEDQDWREKRLSIRERQSQLPVVTAWIAVLVIIDNCTRQCQELPLFTVGSKVTSEMIIEALRELLPPDLLFLISDRGTHFTAKAFQELERNAEFIHVLIARHRPQSNGIAERFVRTLKEWLKDKSWSDDRELNQFLADFLGEYNDRPHQGLAIPGLSPNEFANRIWLS